MLQISQIVRADIPVTDLDEAIAFYTGKLGFSLVVDAAFGEGERWVEVVPPQGGPALALVRPDGALQAGRMTGIVLGSSDLRADHAKLKSELVDVDDEVIGDGGAIPLLFFFRDSSGNQLMVIESVTPAVPT